MKITTKLMILFMAALLPIGFVGCSDDDESDPGSEERVPDFVLDKEAIRVKIGPENKTEVNIKEGGGEYAAFSLNENLAKVEVTDNVITVEGFANGNTSLIISDKYSRFRRLPIAVYTTDVIGLVPETIELKTQLGSSEETTANVVSGNGGYKVESDNPAVSATIDEDGKISITATSKKSDYMATVTVTDRMDFSANITVSVKADLNPFTNEELDKIRATDAKYYYYDHSKRYSNNYISLNEILSDGRQRYGWKYYSSFYYTYFHLHIDFAGDKSVGIKNNAQFSYKSRDGEIVEPITLEIIKNDGTNIWGIFFYINDDEEKMYTGYFCDTVNP